MSQLRLALTVLTALAFSASPALADPLFNVTDLGATLATGLNDSGQVVGNELLDGRNGFLYNAYGPNAGTVVDFGSRFVPTAINSSGLMVGTALIGGNGTLAYGTANGTVTPIADAPGSVINGFNAAGQVLTWETLSPNHSVIYNPDGTRIDLGDPPVPSTTGLYATGINDLGQVVAYAGGYVNMAYVGGRAFLYSGGVLHDIGTLPGYAYSGATAINDSGQIVGVSHSADFKTSHAFLYSGGTMRDLGTLGGNYSAAEGINAAGEIYGYSTTANGGDAHAFLYSAGKMLDLTNLLRSLPGPTAQFDTFNIAAINDAGQILIGASKSGQDLRSFLLTPSNLPIPANPIPEPSTLAFFGIMIAAYGVRRVRVRMR